MSVITDEYQKKVLDDIYNYADLAYPIHASILERLLVRKININKLHPNPEDEFSKPEIGPNYGIVGDYERSFREALKHNQIPIEEPLVVEKMSSYGYRLLNGHHRWMAATRMDFKRVPIEIVNITASEDIKKLINKSDKNMCVSIDFDEVILADNNEYATEKSLWFPLNLMFRHKLRKDVTKLINELRAMGFDTWTYTGNFYSEKYIRKLLELYHSNIDGVVNGLSKNKSRSELKQLFNDKYLLSLHIDTEGVLWVNTKTKEYDRIDIKNGEGNWAAEIIRIIKGLEIIKDIKVE